MCLNGLDGGGGGRVLRFTSDEVDPRGGGGGPHSDFLT
jgi:hypothetical protein